MTGQIEQTQQRSEIWDHLTPNESYRYEGFEEHNGKPLSDLSVLLLHVQTDRLDAIDDHARTMLWILAEATGTDYHYWRSRYFQLHEASKQSRIDYDRQTEAQSTSVTPPAVFLQEASTPDRFEGARRHAQICREAAERLERK